MIVGECIDVRRSHGVERPGADGAVAVDRADQLGPVRNLGRLEPVLDRCCAGALLGHEASHRVYAEAGGHPCCVYAEPAALAGLQTPGSVFTATLVFWLLCGPILMLGTTICFTHLARPEQEYGGVRMWGTAGWMAAGWLFGLWRSDPDWLCRLVGLVRPDTAFSVGADAFRVASGWAFLLAGFAVLNQAEVALGLALLYFHLDNPLKITGSSREFPSPMKFLAEARPGAGAAGCRPWS